MQELCRAASSKEQQQNLTDIGTITMKLMQGYALEEGKVGVDPVCVLGLNVNKGQEIKLRLRTDDLQVFRKILTIKKTLYHELTHNVHSERPHRRRRAWARVRRRRFTKEGLWPVASVTSVA